MNSSPSHTRHSGFTLIEIMAVVIIMGLLMGIVGVTVFGRVDEARVATARIQLRQIENALEFYRMDNSRYPTTEQGLKALIEAPTDTRSYPPGGYLKNRGGLLDPWENPFDYQSPGPHNEHTFDVWSQGADGAPGGSGLNADIGNWVEDDESQ
ncbi:MAG: type II secretion system major pseudopilin GspG [Myxococcota bacterium]